MIIIFDMKKGQRLVKSKNIGRKFNLLTVLELIVEGDSRRYKAQCDCGNIITVDVRDISRKLSCGCAKTKEQREKAKTGNQTEETPYRYLDKNSGYIYVKAPEDHPFRTSNGLILEHRDLMEKKIGRYLKPEETVHHKNLRRDDNRMKNLELWASRHPKGARIADLIEYAVELLKDYAPEKLA